MRVVIDTNVFISSFFGGNPRKIIDYWFTGSLTLCVSRPIVKEYFDVLGRFEFDDDALLMKLMSNIEKSSNIIFIENPKEEKWIDGDPQDNKFVACALALNAAYIISGDAHLTKTKEVGNIRILTPLDFLTIFSKKA